MLFFMLTAFKRITLILKKQNENKNKFHCLINGKFKNKRT